MAYKIWPEGSVEGSTDSFKVPEGFEPPLFGDVEHLLNMTREEATGLYIQAGRELLNHLQAQMSDHYHPFDDCGDDLQRATEVWSLVHGYYFGYDGLWEDDKRKEFAQALLDPEEEPHKWILDFLPEGAVPGEDKVR